MAAEAKVDLNKIEGSGKHGVILKEDNGVKLEPVESIFLDIEEEHTGVVTEKLSKRKGLMTNLQNNGFGRVMLEF